MFAFSPLERRIWWAGLALFLVTAAFNLGFVALDEYQHAIVQYLPAQESTLHRVLTESYIRSPLQVLPLFGVAKAAYAAGIENPFQQFRVVLLALALFAYLTTSWATRVIFRDARPAWRAGALACLAFHFLSAFTLTRPMFESMAAPWILLCAAGLASYDRRPATAKLAAALGALAVACVFRPQAGVCALAFPLVIVWRRRWRDLAWLALFSAVTFVLVGLPDLFLRTSFHESLGNYVQYNLAYSHTYGAQPFYNYLLLLIGIGLLPFLISRDFAWREYAREFRAPLACLLLFVLAHTLVAHKEERFMIPVLPLFVTCLGPLVAWRVGRGGGRSPGAVALLALNALLLVPTSFNAPQKNVLGLAAYLDSPAGRGFRTAVGIEDSLVLWPAAFIRAPKPALGKMSLAEFTALRAADCSTAYVVRQDYLASVAAPPAGLVALRSFSPGFLEAGLVALNPKHNGRRGSLTVFACGSRHIDQ